MKLFKRLNGLTNIKYQTHKRVKKLANETFETKEFAIDI